jgi:hypothetical protein
METEKQKEKQKQKTIKELQKFKKEFQKLEAKYPHITVTSDIHGELMAYNTFNYSNKIYI